MKRPMMTFGSLSEKASAASSARTGELSHGFEVVLEIHEVGAEEHERGEAGGGDGVAFGHGFHRVAHGVEIVGDRRALPWAGRS